MVILTASVRIQKVIPADYIVEGGGDGESRELFVSASRFISLFLYDQIHIWHLKSLGTRVSLGEARKLVIDGKKSPKVTLKEKKLISLERLKKKRYAAMRPIGNEKKNLPGRVRRKQIHIFWPKDQGKMILHKSICQFFQFFVEV